MDVVLFVEHSGSSWIIAQLTGSSSKELWRFARKECADVATPRVSQWQMGKFLLNFRAC